MLRSQRGRRGRGWLVALRAEWVTRQRSFRSEVVIPQFRVTAASTSAALSSARPPPHQCLDGRGPPATREESAGVAVALLRLSSHSLRVKSRMATGRPGRTRCPSCGSGVDRVAGDVEGPAPLTRRGSARSRLTASSAEMPRRAASPPNDAFLPALQPIVAHWRAPSTPGSPPA